MLNKIKKLIIATAGALIIVVPSTAAMSFACSGVQSSINEGVNTTLTSGGSTSCTIIGGGNSGSLGSIARTVVNLFSLLVGIVSVIMIIYGGFRYITSGGESGAVGNAKNTIIYAIIGLVIVALAQVIVHFVLSAALNGSVTTT